MTDRYADLRAALDAGPKPGRWTWKQVGSFNTPGCAVFWPDTSKGGIHYRRLDSGGGMEQVDAGYIAAAHPEATRALLADYDRMRDALNKLRRGFVAARGNAKAMFRESGNMYHEGRRVAYDQAFTDVCEALAQEQEEHHDNQD